MTLMRPFVPLLMAALLTGCASKQISVTQTGFLADYDQLQASPTIEGMRIYRNEAVNIRQAYDKIMVAPVAIVLAPEVDTKRFTPEEQEKLSIYFHETLQARLAEQFELVSEPGPGVLLLRTAITDLLPNRVYLNLHWSTTLVGAGIGGASIEAELIDALTNERILAFIDGRKGKRIKYTRGLTKWGHTKEVLEKWADILVENLSELEP